MLPDQDGHDKDLYHYNTAQLSSQSRRHYVKLLDCAERGHCVVER